MTDEWLLLKRGLFYRPNNCGYTGIRDEAGRYSYDRAMEHEAAGGKVMLASEAPEFLPAAYDDIVIKRLTKQRDDLAKALQVFLGHDDRFQVAVGGNPNAVEKMLQHARSLVSPAGKTPIENKGAGQ